MSLGIDKSESLISSYICGHGNEGPLKKCMAVEDFGKFEVSPLDGRGKLILGNWKRSIPYVNKDFTRDSRDDPHIKRKLNILKDHPEVQYLEGHDVWSIPITIMAVAVNLLMAYFWGRVWSFSLVPFLLTAYFIGGSMTHIIGVILHEATHNAMHASPAVNKAMLFVSNLIIPVPVGASFRRYHFEHHTYQGVEGKDPDLPLKWEISLIKGSSWRKLLFLSIYPFMYVIRGAAFGKRISSLELYNIAFTLSTDALMFYFWGYKSLLYLFVSLWIGYSFHPTAAHFIQEHYTYHYKQETYSYYGPLNWIFLNIGFHNEHHDFPKIPWSRLPLVKAMAPEFYEPLKCHTSWYRVLFDFVMDPTIGPQSRCVRDHETYKAARKMIVRTTPACA